jgi:hypothetical protein
MKLLIRMMPSLSEGVQYVGMIKPVVTDYEYLITDREGNIDSFTSGIGSQLNLPPSLFRDNDKINV